MTAAGYDHRLRSSRPSRSHVDDQVIRRAIDAGQSEARHSDEPAAQAKHGTSTNEPADQVKHGHVNRRADPQHDFDGAGHSDCAFGYDHHVGRAGRSGEPRHVDRRAGC